MNETKHKCHIDDMLFDMHETPDLAAREVDMEELPDVESLQLEGLTQVKRLDHVIQPQCNAPPLAPRNNAGTDTACVQVSQLPRAANLIVQRSRKARATSGAIHWASA